MNQPFQFDPKQIAQSFENWQKIWLNAWQQPTQTQNNDQINQKWQSFLSNQSQIWQKNMQAMLQNMSQFPNATGATGTTENPLNNAASFSSQAYFENVQKAYEKSCEFIQSQLDKNAQSNGLSADQVDNMNFMTRQYLSALNPKNYLFTNPEALKEAIDTNGQSLMQGMKNYLHDMEKGHISMSDDSSFEIGKNVAATPGTVILRNELIELIQYKPTTTQVNETPLLIIPPCVNKYYLMDLSPSKSMVEYLVGQGQTVFLISWRSATEEMKHFTWDSYVERGVLAATAAVCNITKKEKINALGFCIGGLILSTALCVMKARGEDSIANAIFMASFADHSNPGDIRFFITEELVRAKEAKVPMGGIVSGLELQATFSALRPDDLIWNYVQDNYLKGKTPSSFDLLYWNNDSVDLPLPMHTFFLRKFYLDNALTKPGSMRVCGVPIDLGDITIPTYFFAAEKDHIVPWQSVYSGIALFTNSSQKHFVLGESGHIAGAINPVTKNRRGYWINDNLTTSADEWLEKSEHLSGSWWNDLDSWLQTRSGKKVAAPKTPGNRAYPVLCDAPGEYVCATAINPVMTHFM